MAIPNQLVRMSATGQSLMAGMLSHMLHPTDAAGVCQPAADS